MKRRDPDSFWAWLRQLRMRTLVLILALCLLLIPPLVLWLMPVVGTNNRETIDSADTARRVLGLIEFDHLSGPEIKRRIEELLRIKDSVRNELMSLEQKRAGMLEEIQGLSLKMDKLRMEESRESKELERLKVSIEQVKLQQKEFIQRNTPDIAPPLPLLPARPQPRRLPGPASECPGMSGCWDYSRCSLTSRMPVYLYLSQSPIFTALSHSPYITTNPDHACVHIAVDPTDPESLETLDHWAGDGRNHLVILSDKTAPDQYFANKAVIVSSVARTGVYRPGYDLTIPPLATNTVYSWDLLQPLVPITREYLLEFEAHRDLSALERDSPEVARQARRLVAVLQDMKLKGTTDKFLMSYSCLDARPEETGEWALCGSEHSRLERLRKATFCLVLPPPVTSSLVSSSGLQTRLRECLVAASVPVILSAEVRLPFSEVIDWTEAAIILPRERVTELHFLLRTFPHSDIFSMKRQGRMILESYLSSSQIILETVLTVIRNRLNIPGLPFPDTPSPSIFNKTFKPQLMDHLPPEVEPDESLGETNDYEVYRIYKVSHFRTS